MGLALALGACAWTLISAAIAGGDPFPAVSLLLAAAASTYVSLVVSRRVRWVVPLTLTAAGIVCVWWFRSDLPADGPLQGPLGYTNASGALYVQLACAAMMLSTVAQTRVPRIGGWAAAAVLVLATILTGSRAADALLLLPIGAGLAARFGRAQMAVIVSAVLWVAAVVWTLGIGAAWPELSGSGAGRVVAEAFSARRPALWHQAAVIMLEHPVTGVGPGGFASASSIARADRDARWAHDDLLQQGAETGVPGFALVVGLIGWAFWGLASGTEVGPVAAIGAGSLAAAGIHGSIDHVLRFPAVALTVAALVGVALAEVSGAASSSPGKETEARVERVGS
jgi:O-antigen ligase